MLPLCTFGHSTWHRLCNHCPFFGPRDSKGYVAITHFWGPDSPGLMKPLSKLIPVLRVGDRRDEVASSDFDTPAEPRVPATRQGYGATAHVWATEMAWVR